MKQRFKTDINEFLNTDESIYFIDYVNSRTRRAVNARKKGVKFHSLEELQKEFLENQ
jgi:hypothetical protein